MCVLAGISDLAATIGASAFKLPLLLLSKMDGCWYAGKRIFLCYFALAAEFVTMWVRAIERVSYMVVFRALDQIPER